MGERLPIILEIEGKRCLPETKNKIYYNYEHIIYILLVINSGLREID